jgi:hypothetical protein
LFLNNNSLGWWSIPIVIGKVGGSSPPASSEKGEKFYFNFIQLIFESLEWLSIPIIRVYPDSGGKKSTVLLQ